MTSHRELRSECALDDWLRKAVGPAFDEGLAGNAKTFSIVEVRARLKARSEPHPADAGDTRQILTQPCCSVSPRI
ncbi:hypothetical protein [Parachitinimonas caeni]|uniref:Uncharacterized protein n=1 Tax=Parachitinimonas caeni TaxID=3031301 RepID=A0ABT7E2G2_9NEIS|nr:hypothetical protein [Parachitinimonas caeni]MDK2126491.1 hypothetical protein [Parachitinimonas caeni]